MKGKCCQNTLVPGRRLPAGNQWKKRRDLCGSVVKKLFGCGIAAFSFLANEPKPFLQKASEA